MIRIDRTHNLPCEWKTGCRQDPDIPPFHHWIPHKIARPRVFFPKYFAYLLDAVRTSPHATSDHIARRALEGCGSCKQEPTNESDIVIIIVEFVFVVVDSQQSLQVELVPK